jgi:hypothetical protein
LEISPLEERNNTPALVIAVVVVEFLAGNRSMFHPLRPKFAVTICEDLRHHVTSALPHGHADVIEQT